MRKFLVLPVALTCLLLAVNSVWAQTASLTATVRPNPLIVEIIAPSNVSVGQWFEIKADVSNLGTETISRTVATIYTPSEISVKGPKEKIGDLAGGGKKTVIWQAKANRPGSFIIQVEVTGELAGESISASDSPLISASSSALANLWRRLIFGG